MLDFTATGVRGLTANVLHTGAMIFLYLKLIFLFLFDSSFCFVETLNECLFRSSVNIPIAAKVKGSDKVSVQYLFAFNLAMNVIS